MSQMPSNFSNYYDPVIVICSQVSVQTRPKEGRPKGNQITTSEYRHTARNRLICYPYPIR